MNESREMIQDQLNKSILLYGTRDPRTIALSQRLDFYVVIEQRAINYGN